MGGRAGGPRPAEAHPLAGTLGTPSSLLERMQDSPSTHIPILHTGGDAAKPALTLKSEGFLAFQSSDTWACTMALCAHTSLLLQPLSWFVAAWGVPWAIVAAVLLSACGTVQLLDSWAFLSSTRKVEAGPQCWVACLRSRAAIFDTVSFLATCALHLCLLLPLIARRDRTAHPGDPALPGPLALSCLSMLMAGLTAASALRIVSTIYKRVILLLVAQPHLAARTGAPATAPDESAMVAESTAATVGVYLIVSMGAVSVWQAGVSAASSLSQVAGAAVAAAALPQPRDAVVEWWVVATGAPGAAPELARALASHLGRQALLAAGARTLLVVLCGACVARFYGCVRKKLAPLEDILRRLVACSRFVSDMGLVTRKVVRMAARGGSARSGLMELAGELSQGGRRGAEGSHSAGDKLGLDELTPGAAMERMQRLVGRLVHATAMGGWEVVRQMMQAGDVEPADRRRLRDWVLFLSAQGAPTQGTSARDGPTPQGSREFEGCSLRSSEAGLSASQIFKVRMAAESAGLGGMRAEGPLRPDALASEEAHMSEDEGEGEGEWQARRDELEEGLAWVAAQEGGDPTARGGHARLEELEWESLSQPEERLPVLVVEMFRRLGLAGEEAAEAVVDPVVLYNFVLAIRDRYEPNPYHNFFHAVDVTHTVFVMLRTCAELEGLAAWERFALMVAAVAHDVAHRGVSNQFLVQVRDDLALLYNDESVQEAMHASTLFQVAFKQPGCNVFGRFPGKVYQRMRRFITHSILHTDMARHFSMISSLEELAQDMRARAHHASESGAADPAFDVTEERLLIHATVLHFADLGSAAKPWEHAQQWAGRVMDEFFDQGDLERHLGLPVTPWMDREAAVVPVSQLNFLEHVVAPLFARVADVLPCTAPVLGSVAQNYALWATEAVAADQQVEPAMHSREEGFMAKLPAL